MDGSYWMRSHPTRRGFLRAAAKAAGVLVLAPAVAACRSANKNKGVNVETAAKPAKGGTLISSMFTDAITLDYAFAPGAELVSTAVIGNCVEPLLSVDTHGQPSALLATSWESPDDRTYVFRLRQGVKFQDGSDFNADAVEYSLNRIRTNKASNYYSSLISVDKIEKPNSTTVKLTLSSPNAPLLYGLAGNPGRVISPAMGEQYGRDRLKIDLTSLGTGPFKFSEWKKDDHITLVRNESYWGTDAAGIQLPYVDKLVYRVMPDGNVALAALRNGEIDAIALGMGLGGPPKDTASVKADPALRYQDAPSANVLLLAFNEAKEPLSSRELRQAISYAIDRPAITHSVLFDTALPLDVVLSPAIWTYDPDYHPYLKRDVGKAKQLLAQAGRPNGFAFTLSVANGTPVIQQQVELIKDQVKEIGIDMTLQLSDSAKVLEILKNGEHQAARNAWGGNLDPNTAIYPLFSTMGSVNSWTHFNNPDVDRLLEQARTTLDPVARKPLYQQAQKLIMADAPICVYAGLTSIAISSVKVHNVPLGPSPAVGASQVWKTG